MKKRITIDVTQTTTADNSTSTVENEKITLGFIPAAVAAIDAESAASRMNRHDVANRAVQLYHFLMNEERDGRHICVRDPEDGKVERVRIVTEGAPGER